MPHQEIVEAAIDSYKQSFGEAVRIAQTLTLEPVFSLRFNTSMLSDEWITAALGDLRTGYAKADRRRCVMYVFELADKAATDTIFSQVSAAKEQQDAGGKKRNLCAINLEFSGSTTLYVGRSFSPRSRIRQHLGVSDGGTYAMHLEQWARPLALELDLAVYDVPQYRDAVECERAMNVLETGLWDYLKPLLGRRGDK